MKTDSDHKIWRPSEQPENAGKTRIYPPKEISENCLTKGTPSFIIVKLACGKPWKSEPANLENDTEKKRANNKESIAKIPKSLTRKCLKD